MCLRGRSYYGPAWRCLFQPTLPQDEPFESRAACTVLAFLLTPLLSPLSNAVVPPEPDAGAPRDSTAATDGVHPTLQPYS